jgi:hypothetical protein
LNEPIYRLSNGTKLTNQEILMSGLTRYCTSCNLYGTVCKYFELEFTKTKFPNFYNGHSHGIKYLTVERPNGMTFKVYGPCFLGLLRDYELHHQLQLLPIGDPNQYCTFVDGIFPTRSHLRSGNIRNINPIELQEKEIMPRI